MNVAAEQNDAQTGWATSVGELMMLFWKSLRAISPTLLEARFEIGDDAWDAVTEALFDWIVEESIRYSDAVHHPEAFDLPSFEFTYDPSSVSHIEVRHKGTGQSGAFLRFGSTGDWPDFEVVSMVEGENELRLAECEWFCVIRDQAGERKVTTLIVDGNPEVAVGAHPTRSPSEPAKQRMPLDEWHRWWKHFGQVPLRHMLLLYWDPIGVYGASEAIDEYDSYVGKVGSMLGDGASIDELAFYLSDAATTHIGMSSPNATAVARRIVAWFDESTQRFIETLRLYGADS